MNLRRAYRSPQSLLLRVSVGKKILATVIKEAKG
jgi:hypothetical protein